MREDILPPDKLKDVLITRTAIKTLKSEDVVEKVISHQFKSARDAFKRYNEIEVSGLGKYIISARRLRVRLKKHYEAVEKLEKALLKRDVLPGWRVAQLVARLEKANEGLEYLKTKVV